MFDLAVSMQAASRLLRKHGGRMDGGKLVKLLYLADREAIAAHYIPITGDGYCAMKGGPVCSRLYALARGEGDADMQKKWDSAFKREGGDVVALKELPSDWMSEFEADILDAVGARFGGMSPHELSEWTHSPQNCPEWKAPQGEAEPISHSDIMRALGFAEDDIDFAKEDLALYEEAQKSWELLRAREE